nr:diverse immunoglobulin domain-containing protein 1.9 [Danio rerio]
MADRSPLFLLLIFWTLSTDVFGAEETHEFSSGETVHLPCNDTDQHCSTSGTTWLYSRDNQAVELISLGVKKTDTGKHERLNLGSDCSLTISRVTTGDAGSYTCQQWRGDQKQGNDSRVFLDVVADSLSSSVLSVLLSAAALAVFIAAVLCLIQRRRRAAHQRASGESAVKDENQVHYQTIHMSINPAARAHEQTEDSVTYSEVTCAGKKPEKSASDDDGNDSVTYAAVSRRA